MSFLFKFLLLRLQNVSVCSGVRADDLEKLKVILELVPDIEYIFLLLNDKSSVHFLDVVKHVRKDFPHHTIIVCELCFCLFITV